MSILQDLIQARVPVIAVVHPDQRWARHVTLDVARAAGMRIVEWTAASGWVGSEDLLKLSGLTSIASVREDSSCIYYLSQLVGTLRGSSNFQERIESTLKDIIAVIHDSAAQIDHPVLQRLLFDAVDLAPLYGVVVALMLPASLPDEHPLRSICVEAYLDAHPIVRYGELVRAFLDAAIGTSEDPKSVKLIAEALNGLTLTHAEAVLRLVGLEITSPPDDPLVFVQAIQAARQRIESKI